MSIALATLLFAGAAFADLDAIDGAVSGFTGAPVGTPGGAMAPVDRRLRLSPCPMPLALSWRTGSGASSGSGSVQHTAVIVRCPQAGGWRLYVPVQASASAAVDAAPAVSRGDAVAITVTGDGFSVTRPGQALESGATGAWIKVRPVGDNPRASSAGTTLQAQVVRPGIVAVPVS